MAVQVYLNRVNGSSAGETATSARFTEKAFVTGLSTDSPAAVKALALVAPGVPKIGEAHPAVPRARLVSKEADPAGPEQCWVTLVYETPSGSLTNVWTLNWSTVAASQTTQLFPDTFQQLLVGWKNPLNNKKTYDTVTINYSRPLSSLTAEGEVFGRPPRDWFRAIGTVNNATWQGRDKGYWLCTGVNATTNNNGASYRVKVDFLSRVHIDWSEWGLCRDFNTGKFVRVKTATAQQLRAKPYTYGVMYGPKAEEDGIVRVCPYKEFNFSGVFRNIPFS